MTHSFFPDETVQTFARQVTESAEETPERRSAQGAVSDAETDAGSGAVAVTRDHRDYPSRLLELSNPPAVLFARGVLAMLAPPVVAIVGTRNASPYGIRVARSLATTCANHGVCVISGLARGIDGASHEAALAASGRTVAVLGTGLDLVYPRSHRALQKRIGEEGLLLSELPARSSGHGGSFPLRNRIIAALADITIVVEAGIGSGALITARHAQELHRDVACVPNAIDQPGAAGSNLLLKDGAEPILDASDVLTMLHLVAVPSGRPRLDGDAASCWDAVERGAVTLAGIAELSGLSARSVSSAIADLEIEGLLNVDMLGYVRSSL